MKRTSLFVLIVVLLCSWGSAQAAPRQQTGQQITIMSAVEGTLDAATPEIVYTVHLYEKQVISVVSWLSSGDLIIDFTLTDPAGQMVPDTQQSAESIVVEAMEAAQEGDYTLTLRRSGNTSGSYGLLLIPGYSLIEKWDDFSTEGSDFNFTWSPFETDNMNAQVVNGAMQINIHTPDLIGYIAPDDEIDWDNLYIETEVTVAGAPSYYEYGFLLRLDTTGTFYALMFSSQNDWSLLYYNGQEWVTVQEWTVNSLIDLPAKGARVGVLVANDMFRVYFNDQFVGETHDVDTMGVSGTIALAAATMVDQKDDITVTFDDVVISLPYGEVDFSTTEQPEPTPGTGVGGLGGILRTATAQSPDVAPTPASGLPFGMRTPSAQKTQQPTATPHPVEPTPTPKPLLATKAPTATTAAASIDQLVNWSSSDPADIVAELQQMGLIESTGDFALTVPTSYGDTSSSGFNYYPLGQGRNFRNFVLGFDAHLDITGAGSGCGMHFRNTGSATMYAMVMEDGAVLLGQYLNNDFHPSTWFDQSDAVVPGQGSVNRVTVVAYEGVVVMYVNGMMAAAATDFEPYSGGIALNVFVAENSAGGTQRTYCQLDNIWLWEF